VRFNSHDETSQEKKGKATKTSNSLLTRLLKGRGKKEKGRNGAPVTPGQSAVKDKPKTPLDRSISEIQQLLGVGHSDPERLALLLSNILGSERQKLEKDQENFDQMVWDIVKRKEKNPDDGSAEESAEESHQSTRASDSLN